MRRTSFAFLVIAGVAPAALAAQSAPADTAPVDFTIRDQRDQPFSLSQLRGHVVVITSGDRTGNRYIRAWSDAVRARFDSDSATGVWVQGHAHLAGIPFFLKGYVRGRFDRGPSAGRVLLDWNGTLARRFGYQPDVANVYVFDRRGALRHHLAGTGSPEATAALAGELARLVAEP